MTEEFVTEKIILFLEKNGYKILAYDYPGTGTGLMLHPDKFRDKNEGIKPDIVAAKGPTLLIIENKAYCSREDVYKLSELKSSRYKSDIENLLKMTGTSFLKTCIGIPDNPKEINKALDNKLLVDIILAVSESGECRIVYGNL